MKGRRRRGGEGGGVQATGNTPGYGSETTKNPSFFNYISFLTSVKVILVAYCCKGVVLRRVQIQLPITSTPQHLCESDSYI